MTVAICGLIDGRSRKEVLEPAWEPMRLAGEITPLHREVADVADGSFRWTQPPEIVGSGYVVKTLEAALWALHDAQDFRGTVLKPVNLGDDADTTGAVCGQLAGACWGESGIPADGGLHGRRPEDAVSSPGGRHRRGIQCRASESGYRWLN